MMIIGIYNVYHESCPGIPLLYNYHREEHKDDKDLQEICLHFFLVNKSRGWKFCLQG